MMKTKQRMTKKDFIAKMKAKLGIDWEISYAAEGCKTVGKGIEPFTDPIFGKRILEDGFKMGSSSWVLICCKKIAEHTIKEKVKGELARLLVFEASEAAVSKANVNRYWAQIVGSKFTTMDYNAIPLKSPEDALKYLTGWH